MTDDVIQSLNPILYAVQTIETWQANSSRGNKPMAMKNSIPMATDSFPVPIHLI